MAKPLPRKKTFKACKTATLWMHQIMRDWLKSSEVAAGKITIRDE